MSRSYKKHPYCSDYWTYKKFAKRNSNKKVRKTKDIANGKEYKKYFDTWFVSDGTSYCTKREAKRWYLLDKYFDKRNFLKYKSEDDYLRKVWYKYYKRK